MIWKAWLDCYYCKNPFGEDCDYVLTDREGTKAIMFVWYRLADIETAYNKLRRQS
jgi:hypothetical protein